MSAPRFPRDFPPAPFDVQCVDVWPPGLYDQTARMAYRKLARAGRIRDVTAWRDAVNGSTVVRYRADIPNRWIREELRAAKYEGDQLEVRV